MNLTGGVLSLPTGYGGVLVAGERLCDLFLPFHPSRAALEELMRMKGWGGGESDFSRELLERMSRYFSGEPVSFSDIATDDEGLTTFARRVRDVVQTIPYGSLLTYGEVARLSGHPGAVRGVGRVMATNRHPLVIPCHRVVGADGSLRGFSAPGGVASKGYILALEGIRLPHSSGCRKHAKQSVQSLF